MPGVAHPWVAGYLAPYTGRTLENYTGYLARWQAWCAGRGIPLEAVTRADIESCRAELAAAGNGARAVRSFLGPIRGLYRWAAEEDLLVRDPAALVRLPRTPRTSARAWLHPDDLMQLLDHVREHADPTTSAMIHLHGLCGTRPGETRAIDVPDAYSYGGRTVLSLRHRKAGAADRITIAPVVAEQIARATEGRSAGPLLTMHSGNRITKSTARDRFVRAAAAAGMPKGVSPYGLRTGFIIIALAAGVPEREVMHYVGHTSSSQTAYYDRLRHTIDSTAGLTVAEHIALPHPAGG